MAATQEDERACNKAGWVGRKHTGGESRGGESRAGQSDINAATVPLPDGYTSGVVDHNGGAVREVGTNGATPGDRVPKPLTQTDVTIIHSFHMLIFRYNHFQSVMCKP